jgi:tetratricopeptide (TPR) repeat protein
MENEGAVTRRMKWASLLVLLLCVGRPSLALQVGRDKPRVSGFTMLLKEGRLEEALEELRRMEKGSYAGFDFPAAYLEVSQAYYTARDYEKSLAVLDDIVRRFPDSAGSAEAHLWSGHVQRHLGHEKEMIEAYKKATASLAEGASYHRNLARLYLARHLTEKGRWGEALTYWETWRPGSCTDFERVSRLHYMTLCRAKIAIAQERAEEAIDMMEKWVLVDMPYHWSEGAGIIEELVAQHRKRGTLDGLKRMLEEALKENPRCFRAEDALKYMRFLAMAEQKDVAGLFSNLRGMPYEPDLWKTWENGTILPLLLAMPERTREHALQKLAGDAHDTAWAAMLLADMKVQAAVPSIVAAIEAAGDRDQLCILFWALASFGTEEVCEIIERYAHTPKRTKSTFAAQRALQYCRRRMESSRQ